MWSGAGQSTVGSTAMRARDSTRRRVTEALFGQRNEVGIQYQLQIEPPWIGPDSNKKVKLDQQSDRILNEDNLIESFLFMNY